MQKILFFGMIHLHLLSLEIMTFHLKYMDLLQANNKPYYEKHIIQLY